MNKLYVYVKDNQIVHMSTAQCPSDQQDDWIEHLVTSETEFLSVELVNGELVTLNDEEIMRRLNAGETE